jgi:hypothetical protein
MSEDTRIISYEIAPGTAVLVTCPQTGEGHKRFIPLAQVMMTDVAKQWMGQDAFWTVRVFTPGPTPCVTVVVRTQDYDTAYGSALEIINTAENVREARKS